MGRVVLVTGVCRDLGGRFARRISQDPSVDRTIGVDVVPPRHDLGDVRLVRADIRNSAVADVIAAEHVDTVVHLGVIATPRGAGDRSSMKEINVIGTMQLLAACQQALSVRTLVVKSSAQVYGSSAKDPVMFVEEMASRQVSRTGFGKDSVEVEGYVRGFARRRPDMQITMLRFANLIGPRIQTALTRYFELPVVPTVAGFDPRLQFIHEDDALNALHHATVAGVHGTFNVAGDRILTLTQAVRRLGSPSLPLPPGWLSLVGSLIPQARHAELTSEQIAYLSYGRGVDTTAMRQTFGFEPAFTTPAAFDEFARRVRPQRTEPQPERVAELERQISSLATSLRSHAGS
ncbi:MAG: NAD-dependent epimerase/dehydratase family protein [Nocardioidaceae bacterium]